MDRRTHELVAAATRALGRIRRRGRRGHRERCRRRRRIDHRPRIRVSDVVAQVDAGVTGEPNVVAGVVPGGLFLDQDVLAQERDLG